MAKVTEKQKKLAQRLKDNLTTKGKVSNVTDMLEEVGYKTSTARHKQSQIVNSVGVQQELKPVIQQLEKKRQMAINRLTGKKMDMALGRDLTSIIDILTKNIQLMGGGATERTEITGFTYVSPKSKATESPKTSDKPDSD